MDRSHCSINTFFNNSEKSGNSRTTRRASLDFRDTDDALGEKKIKEINGGGGRYRRERCVARFTGEES